MTMGGVKSCVSLSGAFVDRSIARGDRSCLPRGRVEDDDDERGDDAAVEGGRRSLLRKCSRRGPVPNVPCTLDRRTNWTERLPLPTPEQRLRETACQIVSDLVPINVSGSNFERQASARRSFAASESVVRRKKRLQRRKTITGIPEHVRRELGCCHGADRWRCHSLSRLGNSTFLSALEPRDTCDSACQTDGGEPRLQQQQQQHRRGGAPPAQPPHVVSPSERRVRALLHRRDGLPERVSRSQGDVRCPALGANAARRAAADADDSDDDDDDDDNDDDRDSGRGGSGGGGGSALGFSARREFGRDPVAGRFPVTDGDRRQTRAREDAAAAAGGGDAVTCAEVHRANSDARDSASSEEGSVFLPSNSSGSDRVCASERRAGETETAADMANLGHGESPLAGASHLKSGERVKRLNGAGLPPAAACDQRLCASHGRSRAPPAAAHVRGLLLNNGAPAPFAPPPQQQQMPAVAMCAAANPAVVDGARSCRQTGAAGGAAVQAMGKCGVSRDSGSHHRGGFPETESSERSDAGSMFSEDMDGYYTSMHFDSGLRGRSYSSASSEPSHPGRSMRNRSFSITKLRQKPAPPKRDVSLRRDAQPQTGGARGASGGGSRDASDRAGPAEGGAAPGSRRAEEEQPRALRVYNGGTAGRREDTTPNNHRVRDARAAPRASDTPKIGGAFVTTADNGPRCGLGVPNGDVTAAAAAGRAPRDAKELLGGMASPEGAQLAELRRTLKLDIRTAHAATACQKNAARYDDPWVLRDGSESPAETPAPAAERPAVSAHAAAAAAAAVAAPMVAVAAPTAAAAPAAPPAVRRSESVDSWAYDEILSNEAYHSLSSSSTATGTTVVECQRLGSDEALSGASPHAAPSSPATTASSQSKSSSPEKVSSVTSPSSGYSSQSGTPTSLVPAPLFPRSGSPAVVVKVKPKVPERTSSLKPPITHKPHPPPPVPAAAAVAIEYREIVASGYAAAPGSLVPAGQTAKPGRDSPTFHFPPDPCFVTASLDGILLSRVMSSCPGPYGKRGHLVQSASFPCRCVSGGVGAVAGGGGGGAVTLPDSAALAVEALDAHVGKVVGTPVADYGGFVKVRTENDSRVLPKPLPDLLTDSQRPARGATSVSEYRRCGARHHRCQADATELSLQASLASPRKSQDFIDRQQCFDPTFQSSRQHRASAATAAAVTAAAAVGVAAETVRHDVGSSAWLDRAEVPCDERVDESNEDSESEPLLKSLEESNIAPATPAPLARPSPSPAQRSGASGHFPQSSAGPESEPHSYREAAAAADDDAHREAQPDNRASSPPAPRRAPVSRPESPRAPGAAPSRRGPAGARDEARSRGPAGSGGAGSLERAAACNGGPAPRGGDDEGRERRAALPGTAAAHAPGIPGKEQETGSKEAVAAETEEGSVRISPEADDGASDGALEFRMAKVVADESDEGMTQRTSSRSEDDVFVTSPSVSMTTADLFEAIYRSKRKFLGRKESAEKGSTDSAPGSPVVTSPLIGSPVLASARGNGSPRLSSPHGRRSQTSQEQFKALLLRKGSRSDAGSRMSAAELLKHTKNAAAAAAAAATAAGSPFPNGSLSPLDARSPLARGHCESPAAASPGWHGHATPGRREHRARHPLSARAGVRGDGVAVSPGARHGPRALRLASVRHSPAMQPISEGEGETAEAAAADDDDDDDDDDDAATEEASEGREEEQPSGSKVGEQ